MARKKKKRIQANRVKEGLRMKAKEQEERGRLFQMFKEASDMGVSIEGLLMLLPEDAEALVRLAGLDLTPLKEGAKSNPASLAGMTLTSRTPLARTNLIREVLRLGREILVRENNALLPYTKRSCFLHPDIKDRIRELGEEMWELTKEDDPDFLHWFLQCDLLSIPRCFRSEIVHVWDGVGLIRA